MSINATNIVEPQKGHLFKYGLIGNGLLDSTDWELF